MSAASAIARRTLSDSRTRTVSFALLFAGASAAQVLGYRRTYPTVTDRIAFARSFGGNTAVRLFYGMPHDLLTVGGYAGWRVGGFMSIFAAVWGALAAVRAMRTDEENGHQELILAAPVSRARLLSARLSAIAAGMAVLWIATFVALAGSGLPSGGSAYLALAVVSPIPAFVGVGAVASQLASSRKLALGLSLAVLGIAFVLRVVADTAAGLAWLRWLTPLGWTEQLRPFATPRPLALLPLASSGVLLIVIAVVLSARRDVGSGVMHLRDTAPPRLHLLSSATALAARGELGVGAAWVFGVGAFALVMGLLSNSFSGISSRLRGDIGRLGGGSLITPSGVLSFYFLLFVVVISLFACSQVVAARQEEAEERLETLLSLTLGRRRWFGGRMLLAVGGAAALALCAGVMAWVGAASQGAGVSLSSMLGAGANCLPAAVLFLTLASAAFAAFPRATAPIAYGLVVLAFLLDLFGGLVRAPGWILELSPFHHIGLVPASAFRPAASLAMLGVAGAAAVVAVLLFGRRDITGQ